MKLLGLLKNRSGNVAMMFGLMLVPLLGVIGLAVDTSRAYAVKYQLTNALDAAALAGGRNYSSANRDQIIRDFFEANWKAGFHDSTVSPLSIVDNPAVGSVTVSAQATMPTIFVQLLGVEDVNVTGEVQAMRNETTLEVALAIDTTGSMNSNDDAGAKKMTSAISAANVLLNILFNNQDTSDQVYVSVVPFVQNVNVGNNYSSWLASGSEAAVPWNSGPYPSSGGWKGCMFERLDASGQVVYETDDSPPSVQKFMPYADSYFGPNCPAWSSGEKGIEVGTCRMNAGSVYTSSTAGVAGSTAPTHTTGSASDGTLTWVYRRPIYPTTAGFSGVSCPVWRAGESVASGQCRTAPTCPAWATGQSITAGNCRTSSGKMYSATTSGTTSGGSGPSHSSGSSTSGGITWQYRATAYTGSSGNMYVATSNGTTGNLSPLHLSNSSTSDGSVNWRFYRGMWMGSQVFSSTGDGGGSYYPNSRVNPWYQRYYPRNTGTTSGTTPPTHNSGYTTSGGLSWQYKDRITAEVAASSPYGGGYNSGCGSAIVPLTNNRLTAKATIDSLSPSTSYGGTMTNMGLVWGWRSISPRWRGLWSGVDATRPFDYNVLDNFKALIILTDGENVFTQCSNDTFCRGSATPFGYLADGRLSGATDSATAVNNLNSKVTEICDSVRATGTLIYAVMFDLPAGASTTRTLFSNCVGDSSRFFDVVDSNELEQAFQTIAADLTKLRLSK